ncbi:LuxR C-terminal-related transcriptional regulator [Gordonia sp. NPDC058843]|uniref:helix-turn-helix transcriptional regulator n=1 Tax=Gordonia sp. NPDC058843 TaxID=3346648 RepID=UPI00369D798C
MTSSSPTVGDRREPTAASPASTWVNGVLDRAQSGIPLCAFVIGTPGSGRSALLNTVHEQLRRRGVPVSVGLPVGDAATPGRPLLVLADDIHTWPGDAIESATAMLEAGRIGLIATTEPRDAPRHTGPLIARARLSGATLELDPVGTAEVLSRAAGAGLTLAPTTASLIRRRCGGARAVVDAALVAIREAASDAAGGDPVDEVAIAEHVARERHHRLLRRLDPLTLAILALASVRAPLDPDSIAEVAGADRDAAIEALDRARGSGLLRGADTFVSAALEPLREILGEKRIDELRRRSAVTRLRATHLTADDALLAAEAGVADPRIVDTLLAGAAETTAARAVVLLRAADRVEPGRDDIRLLMAQRALASGDVDGAGLVADRRLETAAATDPGVVRWVGVAATVAHHRGLASHAADLYRWLGPEVAAAEALPAVIALIAVGDRRAALAVADADRGHPPVGSRAARSMTVRGLLASVDDTGTMGSGDAVDAVVRGLCATDSGRTDPTAARTLYAATSLACDDGNVVAARTVRALAHGPIEDLLDAEIALATGDVDAAARLLPTEDPAGMPERFRVHAVRLGLARRNGDVPALTALWEPGLAVLAATEVDLYMLRPLAEFWQAAARVGQTRVIARHVGAADRLLAGLDSPAAWSAPWQFAGVQAAILAGDGAAADDRLDRLESAAARSPIATALATGARVWVALAFDRAGSVAVDGVSAAVDALRGAGSNWEAARLAGAAASRAGDPATAAGLLDAARSAGEELRRAQPVGGPLTDREAEVARELLQGYTYREIGERLYISAKTVEHHVARIRRRLDAGSRSQLLAALRAAGYG